MEGCFQRLSRPWVNRAQCCLPGLGKGWMSKNARNVPVLVPTVREKDLVSIKND